MHHWYVIHTKPREEEIAEVNLKRQGYQVFLPRCVLPKRRRSKWREVIEPLFPRYLFIQLDIGAQNIAPIRSTRGVSGLVRFGELPSAVPDDFMQSLMTSADPKNGLYPIGIDLFKPGETISVIDGPFKGLQGIFKAESGKERVTILLTLIGREHNIELDRNQIAPFVA